MSKSDSLSTFSSSSVVSTGVLVLGGSLVGLSAGLFLAERGVPVIVIERHANSAPHPRAIGFTNRTMEIYASSGLTTRIPVPDNNLSKISTVRRIKVDSLAGKWHEEELWTKRSDGGASSSNGEDQHNKDDRKHEGLNESSKASPYFGIAIAQDKLEPLIRARAIELGADIRMSTELLDFCQQEESGITARVRHRESGTEYALHASYMIAADGSRSSVRDTLGIKRQGLGLIRIVRSVLFKARALNEYFSRGYHQFAVEQEGFSAFLTTYGEGRYVLMFTDDHERDESMLRSQIHRAVGRSDFEAELITTGRWELSALIADTFARGRVFLAGDAAHTLPPSRGGFGANTGIEDVHNLSWKLAAVLAKQSSVALLHTYDTERRPIAWLRYNQIFLRDDYKRAAGNTTFEGPILPDEAIEFGQLIRSKAILPSADESAPSARRPHEWTGQPGTRAQHLPLRRANAEKDDRTISSTLHLFLSGWVLLTEDARWLSAAAAAAATLKLKLDCVMIGTDYILDEPHAFPAAFGITGSGASLVRPDGYIAWRVSDFPNECTSVLTKALATVSFSLLV